MNEWPRLAEQRADGDLGPAFEAFELRQDVCDGAEAGVEDVFLAGLHLRQFDVAEMDHAEVDLADGGFVVVDQAGDGFGVGCVDGDFLGELAQHAVTVDVVQVPGRGVDGRDVPADADAAFGVEPAFAHAAPALVLEDLRAAVVIDPAEDDVWDQLLVAGVLFHPPPGQVLNVAPFEQPRQITGHLGRETLEVAQLVEERGGNDQDLLFGNAIAGGRLFSGSGHDESFRLREAGSELTQPIVSRSGGR